MIVAEDYGLGMLAEQAAEGFAWWRGVRPDIYAVIKNLTVPLYCFYCRRKQVQGVTGPNSVTGVRVS